MTMAPEFDSLQFVLVLRGNPSGSALDLWQRSIPERPSPASFQQVLTGGTQAIGIVGGINVALVSQPNRIDIALTPVLRFSQSEPSSEAAPTLKNSVARGLDLAFALASKEPAFSRPAVIFQKSEPFETPLEAVKRVAELTSSQFPPNASDLSYQTIVSSRSNTQPTTTIYRLVRWHSGRKALPAGANPNSLGPVIANVYADVFTDDKMQVAKENIPGVLREIATAAENILEQGYQALLT